MLGSCTSLTLLCGCAQLVCWLELVLIQLATPQASFLGHLCGILAGAPALMCMPMVQLD